MTRGSQLSASAVWRTTPDLIRALDSKFGSPLDSYVNGSQVWLREDGPNDMTIEWRLHPVSSYVRPDGLSTLEVFPAVAFSLHAGGDVVDPSLLWDGLECFAAFGDEIEPAVLASAATDALGLAPDAAGLVDHKVIGDEWERTGGTTSIVNALCEQLAALPTDQ